MGCLYQSQVEGEHSFTQVLVSFCSGFFQHALHHMSAGANKASPLQTPPESLPHRRARTRAAALDRQRLRLCVAVLHVVLVCRHIVPSGTASCPHFNMDFGLTAGTHLSAPSIHAYAITASDAVGVITNGSVALNNIIFRNPEIAGRHLTHNHFDGVAVTVYCAAVSNHGCDGKEAAAAPATNCSQIGGRCSCPGNIMRYGRASSNLWSDYKILEPNADGTLSCSHTLFGWTSFADAECQCGPLTTGTAGKHSKCLGCAGPTRVNISGTGAYNASLLSTCPTRGEASQDHFEYQSEHHCWCNASGVPNRAYKKRLPSEWQEYKFDDNQSPLESHGVWNASGDCTFDNVTGSGQCDCSQRDGGVITPLGPWIPTGNCSAPIIAGEDTFIGGSGHQCGCSNRGDVQTPATTYNSSHDPSLSYISEWESFANTSLSYVTSQASSFNASLSYPRTYTSVHNASLSYITSWKSEHNASLSYVTAWTSVHNASMYYVTSWETVYNRSKSYVIQLESEDNISYIVNCGAINCSCSEDGVSSTISPWSKDCGCACRARIIATCSASNCSCSTTDTPDGVVAQAVTHSPTGKSCGCRCVEASRVECSASNCSCSTTDTPGGVVAQAVTHSPIGKSCGCGCAEETRAHCSASNCSCIFSIASQSGSVLTHSPFNYNCGCRCAPATHATCSQANCSCASNYFTPSPVTHSPIGKSCGCGCRTKSILNCSSANCTCNLDGNPVTTSPIGQSCGCRCTSHICGCACKRRPCSCNCTKTCSCSCQRSTCGVLTSEDGKSYNSTGGHTCAVAALCDYGFYGGGTYDAFKSKGAVEPFVTKGGSLLQQSALQNTASYYRSPGKHRLQDLKVYNTASSTKRFSLYFKAGPLTSNTTSSFRVLPKSIRVSENQRANEGTLSSESYVTGASLGTYTIYLLHDNGVPITGVVDQEDGFNISTFMVTGAGGDSTILPDYTAGSYARLDAADLKAFDTGQGGSEVESHTILLSSSTKRFHVRFETANQAGRGFQILLKLNHAAGLDTIVLQSWRNNVWHPFRLDPASMLASYSSGNFFSLHNFPTIVRLDGSGANNTINKDGLPSPITVHVVDSARDTLRHANCQACVQVRLMQCNDKTPYPVCALEAQAKCATSSGSRCLNQGDYLDTLKGTTIANLVNGTAVFTDLQVQHVVGAGYKLKFTLNAKTSPASCELAKYNSDHNAQACRVSSSGGRDGDCCTRSTQTGACAAGFKYFSLNNHDGQYGENCKTNSHRKSCCLAEIVGTTTSEVVESEHRDYGYVSIPDTSYSTSTNRSVCLLLAVGFPSCSARREFIQCRYL